MRRYIHSTLRTLIGPAHEGYEEEGSTTVEYAIGAIAAAGFAGLLVVVLKSGAVKGLLQGLITTALTF